MQKSFDALPLHTACNLKNALLWTTHPHINTRVQTHQGKREEVCQGVSANNRPTKPHIMSLTTSPSHVHAHKQHSICKQGWNLHKNPRQ